MKNKLSEATKLLVAIAILVAALSLSFSRNGFYFQIAFPLALLFFGYVFSCYPNLGFVFINVGTFGCFSPSLKGVRIFGVMLIILSIALIFMDILTLRK